MPSHRVSCEDSFSISLFPFADAESVRKPSAGGRGLLSRPVQQPTAQRRGASPAAAVVRALASTSASLVHSLALSFVRLTFTDALAPLYTPGEL